MASLLTLQQQQLNEMTEKYDTLQQETKLLELEKQEYSKELQKLSLKDDESEYTIQELIRQKTATEQQHSFLYRTSKSNAEMLENEHDTNQQLRLKLQENMKKINNLTKENEALKQTNQKYEHELKNANEKIIKLENENKNQTKHDQQQTAEIHFLSTEIQILQSTLASFYKQPVLPAIDSEGPSDPLISRKSTVFSSPLFASFDHLDAISPSNDKMRMFTPDDVDNKTSRGNAVRFAYALASRTSTIRSNISYEDDYDDDFDSHSTYTERFERYASMRNAIVTPADNADNVGNEPHDHEVLMEALNKQRIEYEILLQSLKDENEELNVNLKTLNVEKNEFVRDYNVLLKNNNEKIQREIKLNAKIKQLKKLQKKNQETQNKSFWGFFGCV